MRPSNILRLALRLASAIALLVLAGAKLITPPEVLSLPVWYCASGMAASVVRIFAWAISNQGQTAIAAAITGITTLSFLRFHPLPEAREFRIAVLALLAFLFVTAMHTGASYNAKTCTQANTQLTGTTQVRP